MNEFMLASTPFCILPGDCCGNINRVAGGT